VALLFGAATALIGCHPISMSDTDRAFDNAFSAAMKREQPIDLARLERGPWLRVCAVGEDRPASMLPGEKARSGENAFNEFIDGSFLASGEAGGGALAFRYPDGVEIRPLSGLLVSMGSPINRCVARQEAVLVLSPDAGWRFRDYPTGD
jgi:hypothetical protein